MVHVAGLIIFVREFMVESPNTYVCTNTMFQKYMDKTTIVSHLFHSKIAIILEEHLHLVYLTAHYFDDRYAGIFRFILANHVLRANSILTGQNSFAIM